ncbi:hypothetical protein LCGC14_0934130 [marine sediment metagenome]|uniref:Radical SAM core domain-containing protein n=1 Tax=marine sediment metagenome TaxID=412755 RepID=A0A0F9NRJ0_9ZZZZ|nr:MAG: (Dimethylallyl)adenosine tRNA methylthiotransferase MiaB [Candidatus Lokiarchaeum sp. GC14_75]
MINENIKRKDWRKIDFSLALIYPNVYEIGMSSYSIRLLYSLINRYEKIECERIFLPDIKIKYPASKDFSPINSLRSFESKKLPCDFDILGFSLHFENDYRNILWILEKSNIPLSYQERFKSIVKGKSKYPLIIGGGPVVTSNPIPFKQIFDLFFIGDAEQNLDLFFKQYLRYNGSHISFEEFLHLSSQIKGIFIPSLNNNVQRGILNNLDNSPIPISQLTLNSTRESTIFESNFFVEINRGCPFGCKFCISSFHNSPFRNRSYENIISVIDKGIIYSNFATISLIGSCVSIHPKFKQVCGYIISKNKRLTIPSVRIEHLTPDVIDVLEMGNIKTITIAPETGSENLRYALGKVISNEKILNVLSQIRDSKIKNVKFYFLIGLPNEDEKDIDEIINLLKKIDNLGFESKSLRVNINPFIPKLNTPYEKEIDAYLKEKFNSLITKYKKIEKELIKIRSIKLRALNFKAIVKNARLQTMISIGDAKVSELLLNYYENGANLGALRKAENDLDFSFDKYLLKIKGCYSPWKI